MDEPMMLDDDFDAKKPVDELDEDGLPIDDVVDKDEDDDSIEKDYE